MQRIISDIENLLLMEDNPLDIIGAKTSLEEGSFNFRLHVAEDAEKALSFLHRNCDSYDFDLPCPDLVLLDLRSNEEKGKEILATMRKNPSTSYIPVFVLRSSADKKTVVECYSCFTQLSVEPIGVENFKEAIKLIGEFWMEIAEVPTSLS